MTIDWRNILIGALCITLLGACVIVFTLESTNNQLESTNDSLIVQNVQLTKSVREAKIRGFMDGLITCGNEDIAYFNDMASKFDGELSTFFDELAQGWAYSDNVIQEMVEDYMSGGDEH